MSAPVVAVRDDEIITGEAIALDVQPVGIMMRTLGAIIDVVLVWACLIAVISGASALLDAIGASSALAAITQIIVIVTVLVVLPASVETFTKGRSLGKLAVGGRIVRSDGGAISLRHSYIRALVGVLEIYMTFGAVAFLVGVFSPRAQRLGDFMAGTFSQRTRVKDIAPVLLPVPFQLEGWAQTADITRLPVRLARRMSQFVRQADRLTPVSRNRHATELAAEAAPYVFPLPQVAPELLVQAVVAVRRDREYRALLLQSERVERLTAGL